MTRINILTYSIVIAFGLSISCSAQSIAPTSSIIPIDAQVPVTPTPVKSDGTFNLIYELRITNFRAGRLELTRIEILDGNAKGPLLATFADAELDESIMRPGISAKTGREKRCLDGGACAVVFLHVVTNPNSVPKVLHHRLFFSQKSDDSESVKAIDLAGISVDSTPVLVISPPLRAGPWLVANGLSNKSDHRRALIPLNGKARISQRFATDWVKIGSDGKAARDDPGVNDHWYGYGADILAVANAEVVDVQDGIPENVPLSSERAVPITLASICGNYVMLDLGKGFFALYGHLQPKSIAVKVGDRVQLGQVLGLLGNSGNSDAPHLHLHVVNANSPLSAEGLPYTFTTFDELGTVDSIESLVMGEGWQQKQASPITRREEMPSNNIVIRFQ